MKKDNFSPEDQELYLKLAITTQVIHPLCTVGIVPMIVLFYLNWKIVREARRMATRGLDLSLYRIMTRLVLIFIILNMPRVVFLLYEILNLPDIIECHRRSCTYTLPDIRWLADRVARYLVLLNSSANFIIYCFAGPGFQVEYYCFKIYQNVFPENGFLENSKIVKGSMKTHFYHNS